MIRTRSRLATLMAVIAVGVCAVLVGQPALASAATRPLEILTWSHLHESVVSPQWLDGRVSNPSQTAVTNVVVTVRLLDSAGKAFKTITFPADCIVLDGLATTTFSLAHVDWVSERLARGYTVSAVGIPTFRRALFLKVAVDSRTDRTQIEGIFRSYSVTVTNDRPFDVTGTIVYGQEHQRASGGGSAFLNAFHTESLRQVTLAPAESGIAGFLTVSPHAAVFETATVIAEAVAAPVPGITVETTEVLSPYGGPATIIGTVRDDGLAGVAGATVLCRSSLDGVTWAPPVTLTANAAGSFTLTSRVKRATSYSFSFAGQPGVDAPAGQVRATVLPRVAVSAPRAGAPFAVGRYVSVTGSLSPRHVRGPAVRVLCYRRTGREWVLGAEATATVTKASAYTSAYTARVRLPLVGTWRVVAAVAADSWHAYTVSQARTVIAGRTTLAISSDRTRVSYAKRATLTGTLLDCNRRAIRGANVALESSSDGGKTYTFLKTIRTDWRGRAKAAVKPVKKTAYRFRFAGDAARTSSSSAGKTITSTAITRTWTLPSGSLPPWYYMRGIHLGAGTHEIRATRQDTSWQVVGVARYLGGRQLKPVNGVYRSTFKIGRSGSYTFRIGAWGMVTVSRFSVTIW